MQQARQPWAVGLLRRKSALLLALVPAAWVAAGQSPAPERRADVLILHSYDPSYNWSSEVTLGLKSALEDRSFHVAAWTEYLDSRRWTKKEAWDWMNHVLSNRYAGKRFDLVIACDDAAVEYLLEAAPPSLKRTPVVYCGVGSRDLILRLPRERFTGIQEISKSSDFLDAALVFLPGTQTVVVITDNSPTGFEHREFYRQISEARQWLQFRFLDGSRLPVEEILRQLRALPPDALVVLTHFTIDSGGNPVSPRWVAAQVAKASAAPVISPHVRVLGQGILAGNTSAGFAHGEMAGRMALEVLHGVLPAAIPLREQGNIRLVIDDRVAERWGIPRSLLPRDADLLGETGGWRALSAADRRLIWAGLALVLLQMATIAVLVVNIWRRRRAESDLKESRETLQRAQRTANIGLWSRDPATGALTWSDEVYRIFGVDPKTVKPSYNTFLSFIHPADRPRVEAIVRASDARRQSRVLEFRVQLPDGSERHIRSTGEWTADPDGRPRVAGMVQDITELKHTEELLRQMQRMESVGTLAGGVAHDFNNLLTVINGYSQLLAGALPAEDPRYQHVREIQRAGERAAELTRQLLAFSRKQILTPRLFDLNQLVRESQGLLKPVLGDRVELLLELADSVCLVHADPMQLEQVLINLAANARDAMPRGGRFRIRTAALLMREFSGTSGEQISPGRYVELLVSDDGSGMDEQTRRRIFEPFFTTKPEGKGTGLGLASVYGIVRQSGGWITVSSEPGSGTAFRILLPSAEGALPPQGEPGGARGASGRVLVLDHHPQTGEFIGLALRQAGYEVDFAPDEQGLSRLLDDAGEDDAFSLLLIDLRTPGIDGLGLARRLREQFPRLRALMLFSDFTAEETAALRQGEAVLDAPLTPSSLTAAVRSLLAEPAGG